MRKLNFPVLTASFARRFPYKQTADTKPHRAIALVLTPRCLRLPCWFESELADFHCYLVVEVTPRISILGHPSSLCGKRSSTSLSRTLIERIWIL